VDEFFMNSILQGNRPKNQRRGIDGSNVSRLIVGVLAAASLTSGCETAMQTVLPQPTAEPTPTPVVTPRPDLFDPMAGVTEDPKIVVPLNDSNPATPKPDKFRVTRVDSGELLWIQGISITQSGTPPKEVKLPTGKPDIARLMGIITPAPGQPGWAEVVQRVNRWTLGQDVDVQQDARFPVDLNNRRMVQIFFTRREGRPEERGQRVLLNRMLVRMGYAVVDLNSTASIDVKPWLNDEQFARNKRLGLWGKGIILGQRIPVARPIGARPAGARGGAGSGAAATTGNITTGAASSTTTSETTSTTNNAPTPDASPASVP
jgi:endonuclease YncB( thermonuclease family)